MSDIDPRHIDAVVHVISLSEGVNGDPWHPVLARDLLTSTDPAVLDAMQDALVRAGRLHEDCVREVLSDWTFQPVRTVEMRRFVTDWREVDDA